MTLLMGFLAPENAQITKETLGKGGGLRTQGMEENDVKQGKGTMFTELQNLAFMFSETLVNSIF